MELNKALNATEKVASVNSIWWSLPLSSDAAHAITSRPPFSFSAFLLWNISQIAPLLLPAFPQRNGVCLVFAGAMALEMLRRTTGDDGIDMTLATLYSLYWLRLVDILVVEGPVEENTELREVRLFGDYGRGRRWWKWRIWRPLQGTWVERVLWCMSYVYTSRLVGWKGQVKGIPACPKYYQSRWSYVCRNLLFFWVALQILDVWRISVAIEPTLVSSSATYFGARLARSVVLPYMGTQLAFIPWHSFSGAITVALGIYEPEDWPPLWGSLGEAYTVGRFWGTYWHQTLRKTMQAMSRLVSRSLKLAPNSPVKLPLYMLTAFCVSGLWHAAGAWTIARDDLGSMFYFLLQPCAIVFEMAVIAAAKQVGLSNVISGRVAKALGFVWVFAWFWVTNPFMTEYLAMASGVKIDVYGGFGWISRSLVRALGYEVPVWINGRTVVPGLETVISMVEQPVL